MDALREATAVGAKGAFAILLAFLLAFVAGRATGSLGGRRAGPPDRGAWLANDLDLDETQRAAMREIWGKLGHGGERPSHERRRELLAERDARLRELVPPERQTEFDAVVEGYRAQFAAADEGRKARFEQAVEETRKILRPEQLERFEAQMKNWKDRRAGHKKEE